MKNSYKDDGFGSRIANAAKAKQAAMARIKAQLQPGDPAFEKLRAERQAIAAAREIRQAERKVARAAEIERLAIERAEREAAAIAEAERQAAAVIALQAERKVARDARYAARKARRR